jgi:hypothetical protein
MDTYDLSHKLAFAGRHSPVPFSTGPEYTNSVPGIPVLAELRIFIEPEHWNEENILTVSREICRVLGSGSQFDIGMTLAGTTRYDAERSAAGNIARLVKLDPSDPEVRLFLRSGMGDRTLLARYPALAFEPGGESYWRSIYAASAVKPPMQQ